jgi:PilZ domain
MTPRDAKTSSSDVKERSCAAPERRQSLRHRLRDAPGLLEWCEGREQITCGMKMIDISGGGAAVLADRGPPVDQPVRIRLTSGALGSEPLEARVVSIAADPSGIPVVRMQFTSWISLGSVLEEHAEHRLWQRYPARESRASLIWVAEDCEYTIACILINISGGGAAVFTDEMLPDDLALWLTLQGASAATTPVESRLVGISVDASGLQIARFRFVEACPMDLFELAVHGQSSQS